MAHRPFSDQKHDKLISQYILGMSNEDVTKLTIMTERVIRQLDEISRLDVEEENLVHVALVLAYREFNKGVSKS